MKTWRYISILSLIVLIIAEADAQQTPVFSQYMSNKFLLNPAVAGGNSYTTINMIAREQYTGFVNAPRTFALTGQTRLLNNSYIMRKLQIRRNANQATRVARIGLGGNIYSDRNGIVSKTGFQLSYAYHLNFNNDFQLSLGLAGSAFQYRLDDSDEYIPDSGDPLLNGNQKQFWVPDATFGMFVTNNSFYAGGAITDLFGSTLKLGSAYFKDNFRTARNYNLMAGYRFPVAEGIRIEPSAIVRGNIYETRADFNLLGYYQSDYWLGFSYRTDKTMVTMLGLSVDMFYFSYAYDASFNTIRNYSNGSHEFIIGVRFGDTSTRRYRWIKKDEIEFEM